MTIFPIITKCQSSGNNFLLIKKAPQFKFSHIYLYTFYNTEEVPYKVKLLPVQ